MPKEKELQCRCPVCQSNLKIPASIAAQPADTFPLAELVSKPDSKPANEAPSPPMTEREQKIAAERAARVVSLYPQMKPRLNLVLGDKTAPVSKDGENPPWMKEAA